MFEARKYFFEPTVVDGATELDFLKTSLVNMTLETALTYNVTSATENRADLISKIFFDNYDLAWLIHHHNGFLDPISDYYIGREIKIPYLDDYYQFYNRHSKGFE